MMDTLHARADWESVGDKWFRKTQQYTQVFDQDLDLDNYVVAGAPYAGALGEHSVRQVVKQRIVHCVSLAGFICYCEAASSPLFVLQCSICGILSPSR